MVQGRRLQYVEVVLAAGATNVKVLDVSVLVANRLEHERLTALAVLKLPRQGRWTGAPLPV